MVSQKFVRTTFFLGNIELDVFKLEDGSYRWSKTQIESSLGFEPNRRAYRDFLKSKDEKALRAKSLIGGNIKIKYMSKTYTLVSQDEVVLFWGFSAQNGNQLAHNLLVACAIEALERRADFCFGVIRKETERNDRLKARQGGKEARRTLTDAIQEYVKENNKSGLQRWCKLY